MEDPQLIIRAMKADELDRLHEIDRLAFRPELAYSRAELGSYVTARRGHTLVAELDGRIVGFAVARLLPLGRATVITLDVTPDCQGQGIGSVLLQSIEEWLSGREVREVRLETPVDESGARRFYERHGYRLQRRIAGYYSGGLDAWRLVKRLLDGVEGVEGVDG